MKKYLYCIKIKQVGGEFSEYQSTGDELLLPVVSLEDDVLGALRDGWVIVKYIER